MIRVTPDQYGALDAWVAQERPGPMVAGHVTQTGHGALWVDQWPEGVPRQNHPSSGPDRGGPQGVPRADHASSGPDRGGPEGAPRADHASSGPDRGGPEAVPRADHASSGPDRGGPAPRALIAECAGNVTLSGDPQAVETGALRELVRGFVAAPPEWLPALESAFAAITRWERIILELTHAPHSTPSGRRPQVAPAEVQQAGGQLPAGEQPQSAPDLPTCPAFLAGVRDTGGATAPPRPDGILIRRLTAHDAASIAALSPQCIWVAKTWGGPAGLAASGYAWGAFAEGQLVSIANSFFVGRSHEDLAVATEPGFERRGLSTACAGALCGDVLARGRGVSWTTSPDNLASLRVAAKLGFTPLRRDWLYVIDVAVPQP